MVVMTIRCRATNQGPSPGWIGRMKRATDASVRTSELILWLTHPPDHCQSLQTFFLTQCSNSCSNKY